MSDWGSGWAQSSNTLRGVFSQVVANDDPNLTRTLATGIQDAAQGGIFMGNAIEHITEVLTVQ